MNNDRYEYFVVPNYDGGHDSPERFDELWRCRGATWEYFSLLDAGWHPEGTTDHLVSSEDGVPVEAPEAPPDSPEWRVPVTADRASGLTGDFHQFTRFWGEGRTGDRPTRVFRQVQSPEARFQSYFGRNGRWSDKSTTLNDFLTNGPHQTPDLVELDAREAEEIIEETAGITGATEWWPRVDPDVARFVVSATFVVPGRHGTLVSGHLERGVIRPPTTVSWRTAYKGISSIMVWADLPVMAVEFPSPGARESGEITIVLDHSGIDLEPGTTLYTPQTTCAPVRPTG